MTMQMYQGRVRIRGQRYFWTRGGSAIVVRRYGWGLGYGLSYGKR